MNPEGPLPILEDEDLEGVLGDIRAANETELGFLPGSESVMEKPTMLPGTSISISTTPRTSISISTTPRTSTPAPCICTCPEVRMESESSPGAIALQVIGVLGIVGGTAISVFCARTKIGRAVAWVGHSLYRAGGRIRRNEVGLKNRKCVFKFLICLDIFRFSSFIEYSGFLSRISLDNF